jgi:hypothetical protein
MHDAACVFNTAVTAKPAPLNAEPALKPNQPMLVRKCDYINVPIHNSAAPIHASGVLEGGTSP